MLRKGGKTVLAPAAVVLTETPAQFVDMAKMVTRWARSSNGYTLRAWWLFKPQHWMTAFVYWSNIILAFSTIGIVGYMFYQFWYGDRDMTLFEAFMYMTMSMGLTMTFRFAPVWSRQWRYLIYMPFMGFIGIFMQWVQVYGIITHVHKIGNWGTRGADEDKITGEPIFTIVHDEPALDNT